MNQSSQTSSRPPMASIPHEVLDSTMETLMRVRHSLIVLSDLFRTGSLDDETCLPAMMEYLINDLASADQAVERAVFLSGRSDQQTV